MLPAIPHRWAQEWRVLIATYREARRLPSEMGGVQRRWRTPQARNSSSQHRSPTPQCSPKRSLRPCATGLPRQAARAHPLYRERRRSGLMFVMPGSDVMLTGVEPLPEDLIDAFPACWGKRRRNEAWLNENFAALWQIHCFQRSKDAVFVDGTKSAHVRAILHRDILPVKAFRFRVASEKSRCGLGSVGNLRSDILHWLSKDP